MTFRKFKRHSLPGFAIQLVVFWVFIYMAIQYVAPMVGATHENYWLYGLIGLATLPAQFVFQFIFLESKPAAES